MSEEKKPAKQSSVNSTPNTVKPASGKYAAILIRGLIRVSGDVKDTLRMLNLQKKNNCSILPKNPVSKGMLFKCKDYLTYGELDAETEKELNEKRKTDKKYYKLHPPRGGFERKGTKQPFNKKGALGYRGDKINALIKKML